MADFTREQWEDGVIKVRCEGRPYADDVALYFVEGWRDARAVVRFTKDAEALPQGSMLPPEPSLSLPAGLARELMDQLWRTGIRPSEKADPDAQSFHLADMRALLFAKLGVEKP